MGRIDDAVRGGLVVALSVFIASTAIAEPATGRIKGVKFPEYSDSGALEYMVYSEVAYPRGVEIDMQDVFVDFVKDGVGVEQVKDNRSAKLYTIKEAAADNPDITEFWKLYTKTKAFIQTVTAKYDRSVKLIQGEEQIYFRTEQMDVDGIGFDMDQQNGKLHIRSNVQVVIRETEEIDGK